MEVLTEQVVNEQKSDPTPVAENNAQPASAESQTPAESKPTEPDHASETKKALKGVQKRIDELTRARYEAEERGRQEAEQFRQEALYWRQQAEQFQKAVKPPSLDQFNGDLEQHAQAVAQFEARKLFDERMAQERQQAAEWQQRQAIEAQRMQQAQQYQATLNKKLEEATKKFPDFLDVVSSPELPGIQGTPAFQAILESDVGAEVMYHLGKNPAKAHQILALSPLAQVREIGRIEAALQSGKTVSNAPPPPASVDAKGGTATKDPRNMTIDEYYNHITRSRRGK